MKYPYYNPNLRIQDVFQALSSSKNAAFESITDYYATLTGKKYILITNSCRSALFIAYNALKKRGEVIISPLTCKVAIDPIVESGNTPVFADVEIGNLNISPADIEKRINLSTFAIQVIHLGGVACDMDRIEEIAKKHNLLIIEDCAQGFGAIYKNRNIGSFGNIACFSLIKNAYGIGGGVLATNSKEIFEFARNFALDFKSPSNPLIYYRVLRNVLETYRNSPFLKIIYSLLVVLKSEHKNYHSVKDQLRQVSNLEVLIAAFQNKKLHNLHRKRQEVGRKLANVLISSQLMKNGDFDLASSSYSKFYIFNTKIDAYKCIPVLHKNGVEAMHLEQKMSGKVQDRIFIEKVASLSGMKNYNEIHDSLLSLPLREDFSENDIVEIVNVLKSVCIEHPH